MRNTPEELEELKHVGVQFISSRKKGDCIRIDEKAMTAYYEEMMIKEKEIARQKSYLATPNRIFSDAVISVRYQENEFDKLTDDIAEILQQYHPNLRLQLIEKLHYQCIKKSNVPKTLPTPTATATSHAEASGTASVDAKIVENLKTFLKQANILVPSSTNSSSTTFTTAATTTTSTTTTTTSSTTTASVDPNTTSSSSSSGSTAVAPVSTTPTTTTTPSPFMLDERRLRLKRALVTAICYDISGTNINKVCSFTSAIFIKF